jgi:hypothetical protein
MDHASVLAPIRTIAAPPSMRATPTVRVAKTSGAIAILIRRKKAVVIKER